MFTGFWWGKLKEKDHLEGLRVGGRIIMNGSKKLGSGTWTGLIWLRIRTGGGHL